MIAAARTPAHSARHVDFISSRRGRHSRRPERDHNLKPPRTMPQGPDPLQIRLSLGLGVAEFVDNDRDDVALVPDILCAHHTRREVNPWSGSHALRKRRLAAPRDRVTVYRMCAGVGGAGSVAGRAGRDLAMAARGPVLQPVGARQGHDVGPGHQLRARAVLSGAGGQAVQAAGFAEEARGVHDRGGPGVPRRADGALTPRSGRVRLVRQHFLGCKRGVVVSLIMCCERFAGPGEGCSVSRGLGR
jgi:hypothetical protein